MTGLATVTLFPAIVGSQRLVCAQCGARRVAVLPDWRKNAPIQKGFGIRFKVRLINIEVEIRIFPQLLPWTVQWFGAFAPCGVS